MIVTLLYLQLFMASWCSQNNVPNLQHGQWIPPRSPISTLTVLLTSLSLLSLPEGWHTLMSWLKGNPRHNQNRVVSLSHNRPQVLVLTIHSFISSAQRSTCHSVQQGFADCTNLSWNWVILLMSMRNYLQDPSAQTSLHLFHKVAHLFIPWATAWYGFDTKYV
jgi:hypothetical protein